MSKPMPRILAERLCELTGLDGSYLPLFEYLYTALLQGHLAVQVQQQGLQPSLEDLGLLEFDADLVHTAFDQLEKIDENEYLYKTKEQLFLKHHYLLQNKIETVFQDLLKREVPKLQCSDDSLEEMQKVAIETCSKKGFCIIAGGPGTGKTYLAGRIVELVAQQKKSSVIYLLAPTGKAAYTLEQSIRKNLQSSVHLKVGTLHRILHSAYDQPKKIYGDLVIVDESSMIDVEWFYKVLSSIGPQTRLILLGDPHQLPSVEFGSIFYDLIQKAKKTDPSLVVELKKVYRQESLDIIELSEAIYQSDLEKLVNFVELSEGNSSVDFSPSFDAINDFIEKRFSSFSDPKEALDQLGDAKILTPIRRGYFGSIELNQRILQYKKAHCIDEHLIVPVMVTKNQPDLGLFNGDMGVMVLSKETGFATQGAKLYFTNSMDPNASRKIPAHLLYGYEIAYAISIHKSQGSEFNHIAVVLPEGDLSFGKQLLYTAVTRAKKTISFIGSKELFMQAAEKHGMRFSLFS